MARSFVRFGSTGRRRRTGSRCRGSGSFGRDAGIETAFEVDDDIDAVRGDEVPAWMSPECTAGRRRLSEDIHCHPVTYRQARRFGCVGRYVTLV